MTYTAPPAVSNLQSTWTEYTIATDTKMESGITLTWDAPVVSSGTLAGYIVFVTAYDPVLQTTRDVFFSHLSAHTQKDANNPTTYAVGKPGTSTFFPFAFRLPAGLVFPSASDSTPNPPYSSYAFHVYTTILENESILSKPASISVFRPRIDDAKPVVHLNPRFNISDTGNGQVETFVQDTFADVAASVEMVLSTPTGYRSAAPDFGIDDPTFTDVDPNAILASINAWEPRAEADVTVTFDQNDTTAKVNVRLLSIERTSN